MSEGARRLSAIMFTDMVGFTTMAQRDEPEALRLLREQRALIEPLFPTHGGRVIKTIGDGFLVEFSSAVESVACALEIQASVRARNARSEPSRRFELRIGVHVGDVLSQGADIVGDAVNVASRVEPLAEPGGICISGQVVDQIRNKIAVTYEQLASPRLKNVDFPIEVYRLRGPGAGETPEPQPVPVSYVRLAVLPFSCLSQDPADALFADGLTEELISFLAQGTVLRVVPRTSVMPYKGASKGIREIARELAVASILEGSVRRSDRTVRIAVQLIDARSEEHLWADRYDREMTNILAVQEEIARGVSKVLQGKLVASIPPRLHNRQGMLRDGQNPRIERTTSRRVPSPGPAAS